jgi:predicted transcriptional regulator
MLHDLASNYPSQKVFYGTRRTLSKSFRLETALDTWVHDLARTSHRTNFARFEQLSRLSLAQPLLPPPRPTLDPQRADMDPDLRLEALAALLSRLRERARTVAWRVFRGAYREFGPEVRPWLARQLLFVPDEQANQAALEAWLAASEARGEVQRKEGAGERWVVKVKR